MDKQFTWVDLEKAISKLSPEQKKRKVLMSHDDDSAFKSAKGLQTIEEDVWVHNEDDEDCGNLEDLKNAHGEDFNQEHYRLATPKGTAFLWDGF